MNRMEGDVIMNINNILEAIIAGVVVLLIGAIIGTGVTKKKNKAKNRQKGDNNINIQNSKIGDK